jgi:hypothetical protein
MLLGSVNSDRLSYRSARVCPFQFAVPQHERVMDGIARSQVLDLFTLAIADGFVSPGELAIIYDKGRELGLGQQEVDEAIQNPHRVSFEPPASLVDAVARLYDLAQVLISDGTIDQREVGVLRSFAARFGIHDRLIDRIVAALVEELRAGTSRESLIASLAEEVAR